MNPFDFTGQNFLILYVVVFVIAVVVAVLVRWQLREPSDDPDWKSLTLSPYEVAYLKGGAEQALNAAIARLVHEKTLLSDAGNRKLKTQGTLRANAPRIEQALCQAANATEGVTVGAVRAAAAGAVEPIRVRLLKLGLLVSAGQGWAARLTSMAIVAAAPIFGGIKVYIGVEREKPVAVLVLMCIVASIVACVILALSIHRSRRGDRVLSWCADTNAALELQAGRRASQLSGDDVALAVGLFGLGILSAGPLADLQAALGPPVKIGSDGSSSCGSSCGGSSCGGSSCGGGCGGGCGGCGG